MGEAKNWEKPGSWARRAGPVSNSVPARIRLMQGAAVHHPRRFFSVNICFINSWITRFQFKLSEVLLRIKGRATPGIYTTKTDN
jgi:hypothetical protein